jgi:hypothetical protein
MMRKALILIAMASFMAALPGCGSSEDNSVKEAPKDVQTSTAEQTGRGRQKIGDESAGDTRGRG